MEFIKFPNIEDAHEYDDEIGNTDISTTGKPYNLVTIICTLGPSSFDTNIIQQLISSSVHIFCLDMSNNDQRFYSDLIQNIRNIEINTKKKTHWRPLIDFALKIRGREIYTGLIDSSLQNEFDGTDGGIQLKYNSLIKLTTDNNYYEKCNKNIIYVNYKNIVNVIKTCNQTIVIGEDINYRIVLIVREIQANCLVCTVKVPNILRSSQKVYLPGVRNDLPDITKETVEDLEFAQSLNIPIIITSYVRNSDTISNIRKILKDDLNHTHSFIILANVCDLESLENLDELLLVSDGIILSRDELSVEIRKERMLLVQKSVFAKCNKEGKICVCFSQILNSMRENSVPKIVEAADIQNTILDGVDCFILNYETSIGKYPVEVCNIINKISIETKLSVTQDREFYNVTLKSMHAKNEAESIAMATINVAVKCNAACIITVTVSGNSAKTLAKCKPPCPIIALTQDRNTAKRLFLNRDVWPIWPSIPTLYRYQNWMINIEKIIEIALKFGKDMNILQNGDCVIATHGWKEKSRIMNTMRILYAHVPDDIDVIDEKDGTIEPDDSIFQTSNRSFK